MRNSPSRIAAITEYIRFHWIVVVVFLLSPWFARAEQSRTLESSALRVEVTLKPYSYQVVEKSTGDVLLSESSMVVLFGKELYPVTDAIDSSSDGSELRVMVALQTSGRDQLPSGTPDRAQISFTFLKQEILRVHITYPGGSPDEISDEFFDHGEHYYGVWEYPFGGNIDNRGADQDFLGLANQRYVHHSSVRAPFYSTSRKYGVYVESIQQGHFAIAQAGKTSFSFHGHELTYDVLYGPSYEQILSRYNALAGPSRMPPLWALSSIWWRDDEHEDLRRAKNAQEKALDDADRLRALHLPAGSIWLDRPYGSGDMGWGNMDLDSSFPDGPKLVADLHQRGMNLLAWIANRCSGQLFEEGTAKGYLFPYKWPAADLRRPEVYNWFKEKLDAYVHLGIKGYKIDRGEEYELPDAVQNENAILLPKLAAEGLAAVYGDDYFIFSRNANDISRKYTAVWNGDAYSTFPGLQTSLKTALRAGAMNFPMWGSDTGGYFAPPEKELFARWLEFSAYSSMMEILIGPKRTIWDDYDDELVHIAQTYVNAHHDLIPYTRSFLYQSTRTGMPVMRAMIFSFPSDESLSDRWDEYLYGSEILVAPVTVAQATDRQVYLPAGRWLDYNDKHTVYTGPTTITAKAPLQVLPLFVREGAIIPRGDIVQVNNNWEADWKPRLRIELFPAETQNSEFVYYTGEKEEKITATRTAQGLAIQFGDLKTAGTLEVYCGKPGAVTRNGQRLREEKDYQYDAAVKKLTLAFNGATSVTIQAASSLF
jgi:alpha-D-xyloside xylohydrolase